MSIPMETNGGYTNLRPSPYTMGGGHRIGTNPRVLTGVFGVRHQIAVEDSGLLGRLHRASESPAGRLTAETLEDLVTIDHNKFCILGDDFEFRHGHHVVIRSTLEEARAAFDLAKEQVSKLSSIHPAFAIASRFMEILQFKVSRRALGDLPHVSTLIKPTSRPVVIPGVLPESEIQWSPDIQRARARARTNIAFQLNLPYYDMQFVDIMVAVHKHIDGSEITFHRSIATGPYPSKPFALVQTNMDYWHAYYRMHGFWEALCAGISRHYRYNGLEVPRWTRYGR